MNILTVYDIQNKFIAFSSPLTEVFAVVAEWGSLYIIGHDRKVNRFLFEQLLRKYLS